MKEKEWIRYFKSINNRKPTSEEISKAYLSGQIVEKTMTVSEWEIYFRTLYNRLPTEQDYSQAVLEGVVKKQSKVKTYVKKYGIITAIGVLMLSLVLIVVVPSVRYQYYKSQGSNYRQKYSEIVHQYQDAIDNNKLSEIPQKIVKQPSRHPAYAYEDTDNDGKQELYIAFNDDSDYELVTAFDINFGTIKKISLDNIELSVNKLAKFNWTNFDVTSLETMNLDDISNGNFESVRGLWQDTDATKSVAFDSNGLSYANGRNVRTSNIVKFRSFEFDTAITGMTEISHKSGILSLLTISKSAGSNYTFQFIPKGIEYGVSDSNFDRIIVNDNLVLYRSGEHTKASID
ncbi:hypothetical protein [Streptococcus orisratti]|uniref:hypothetical protein n=1 Tax=Streptococcus orisratti TaxID=114652 RepID=UPI003D073061